MARGGFLWDVVPFIAMVTVEFTDVGQFTLTKAAMSKGMNPFIYVVYNTTLATLLLFPIFMLQRKKYPPITCSLLGKCFLLALFGNCIAGTFSSLGIRYSSPVLASTLNNLIPVFTFLLAVIFRMETLNLRISSSQAKSIGAIVSISGALIVTLYKGPPINIFSSSSHSDGVLLLAQTDWAIGGVLLLLSSMCAAIWFILQAKTLKEYPSETIVTFFFCLFGAIQCTMVSLVLVRDPDAWKLTPGVELLTIIYTAIFGSMYRSLIHSWGIHKKGPVYVAMFRPLGIVIAAITGIILLGDTLHIGSVIGAIVVASGFFAVMWGKAQEEKSLENNGVCYSDSQTQEDPLLPSYTMEP